MNFDFSSTSFSSHFIQLLALLTAGYLIYKVSEHFKSGNKEGSASSNFDFVLLLDLYQKLLFIGGIGFIVSDIFIHGIRSSTSDNGINSIIEGPMNAIGWNNLGFGIILIFLGIALRLFRKGIK